MKIDLHCHSKYSYDNYVDPEEPIEQAMERDLDGVCFTEHHSIAASKPDEKIKVPKDFYMFRGWDSMGEEFLNIDGFHAIETHNGLKREDQNRKAIQIARIKNLSSINPRSLRWPSQHEGKAMTL